jgi:hypothetical protein
MQKEIFSDIRREYMRDLEAKDDTTVIGFRLNG